MPDTIPVGKYYNFDNKNVDVVYNPATDEDKGSSGGYDPYIVEIEGYGTQSMTTDADFATAKSQFLANKPVLFRFGMEDA